MLFKRFLALPLHMRVAIITAPVLAIGGWGLADLWANKDRPKQAAPIMMEALHLQGACWLATNQCRLQNKLMKITMARGTASQAGLVRLDIVPDTNIRGIELSLVQSGQEHFIIVTPSIHADTWSAEFPEKLITPSPSALRIALAKFGSVSYAEISQPHF
ncbi:MAG: hypothetical protein ACK4RS_04395 [Thiothrix sp.]